MKKSIINKDVKKNEIKKHIRQHSNKRQKNKLTKKFQKRIINVFVDNQNNVHESKVNELAQKDLHRNVNKARLISRKCITTLPEQKRKTNFSMKVCDANTYDSPKYFGHTFDKFSYSLILDCERKYKGDIRAGKRS